MMLVVLSSIGIIAFLTAVDAYRAHRKACEAELSAYRAHRRLDRILKTANPSLRETKAVSYTEGWESQINWDDDFKRTQVIPQIKQSWHKRLIKWMFY